MAARGAADDGEVIEASFTDPEWFTAMFERHFDAIYSYAARRLGRALADDVSAGVFVEAFGARHRFDRDRADARPWLYGIATNLIRQHRRSEVRRLKAYARADRNVDAEAIDLEGRMDAAATGPLLAAALHRLAPSDRDALLLFVWADLSYEDIATATTVPIGTVRSRIHRARTQLRVELGADGLAPSEPADSSRREGDGA